MKVKERCRVNRRRPMVDRFWEKVEQSDGCWLWTGVRGRNGYGRFMRRAYEEMIGAHQMSWEIANGREVPAGMCVLHSCDNPPCVNPDHLTLGTRAQNTADMMQKGRNANQNTGKVECKQGHSLSGDNLYLHTKNGCTRRICRTCRKAAHARFNSNAVIRYLTTEPKL